MFWAPEGITNVKFCCTQKDFVLNDFNFILVADSVTGLAAGQVEGGLLKLFFLYFIVMITCKSKSKEVAISSV